MILILTKPRKMIPKKVRELPVESSTKQNLEVTQKTNNS